MTRTIKKALTVFLLLCLTMALGAAALASDGAKIEAAYAGTVGGNTLTAGVAATGTITVTATGCQFNEADITTNVTADAGSTGLTIGDAEFRSATQVAFSIESSTPTKGGTITITAKAEAFEAEGPGELTTTITVKGAEVTATATGSLQAGETGNITVTASGSNFTAGLSEVGKFTVTGTNAGSLNITSVSVNNNIATLTMAAPTKAETSVSVTITNDAFEYQPENQVTATSSVTVSAAAEPDVAVSGGPLTAGVEGGSITLTINGGTNSFANSLEGSWFKLTTSNSDNLTVSSASPGNSATTTLTVSGTPTKQGSVTKVTIDPQAFKYQPGSDVETKSGSVTISPAIVTIKQPTALVEGKDKTISLELTAGTFNSGLTKDNFTVTGGSVTLSSASYTDGTHATLTLDAAPTSTAQITVEAHTEAFQFQPSGNVSTTVQVNPPTGTVTAALVGNQLYAGTAVSGQTIKLTIDGDLTFKSGLTTTDAGKFTLNGNGSADLSVTNVSYTSGSEVSLTLSGTPKTAGTFGVKIDNEAFTYAPSTQATTDESITVNPAPTVTLNGTGITAGNTDQVVVKIGDPNTEGVKFVNDTGNHTKFKIGGAGFTELNVTKVEFSDESKTATLTLSAVPTTTGTLTVTVDTNAFTPVATVAPVANVTVSAPEGTIEATQKGTLTAGTAASNVTVDLKITGTLNFKNASSAEDFTLSDADTGLSISNVAYRGGKNVTLTLSGTPKKQGNFQLTVKTSAFVAKPDPDNPVTATGDISVNYPTVTVAASPTRVDEGEENPIITLTATGSPFNETSDNTNFTIDFGTVNGLSLGSVSASGKTATLTLSGNATSTGDLTITVQPGAFQYQPGQAATATVTVGPPEGTIEGTLNGTLYAGTPVSGQTITLTVVSQHGLHFKTDVGPDAFQLEGTGSAGLQITAVTEAGETATLTLSGAPTTAGGFTVKALKDKAFKQAPANDLAAKGTFTVQPAPSGTVTAALSGPLYAGTPADGTTVTLTAGGLTFAAADKSNFALTVGSADMTIADAKLSDGKIVLTLSGTPKAAGVFQVQVANTAFTVYPAGVVTSSDITVGAANIKLTVSDNGLQAGKKDMTFTVTPSGGKLIDLANRAAAIDTGEDLKGLTLGDMTQNQDGSVTVTVMGMPPVAGSVTLTLQPSMFDPQPAQAVSVTVPVAEGEQAAEPETKPGAPGIGFTAPVDDLASAVLTPEEQALYEKGAQVLIELVESPGAQVPEADKTAVAAAAGDYTVGEYLDVSLIKTINGVSGTVSETSKPIQVVFTIPEDLRASGRQFAVIRVHEGKAEFLKTVASTATTITVESDLFSTYAIVYQEAPASTDKPDTTDKPDATPAPTTAPHTGDETPLLGWTALLLGCAAALVLTAAALRRRRDRG